MHWFCWPSSSICPTSYRNVRSHPTPTSSDSTTAQRSFFCWYSPRGPHSGGGDTISHSAPQASPRRSPAGRWAYVSRFSSPPASRWAWLAGGFGGFCELTYEIDRVWLLAQGHLPYVGFELPFGVLFLYGPLWLSHLFHGDIAQGYNAFWTLSSVAGVALLFATINRLDTPTPRKTFIFLILFVAFLPSCPRHGRTLHITALHLTLLLHSDRQPGSTGNTRRRAQRLAAALAVCFTAMLLLISPEMAIAHAFACSILLFPRKSAISPAGLRPSPYAAMLAGLAALFAAALKLHLLDTLIASGGGADSFPIPFSVPVLFFYAVVFVCACWSYDGWRALTDRQLHRTDRSLHPAAGRCPWPMRSRTHPVQWRRPHACRVPVCVGFAPHVEAVLQRIHRCDDCHPRIHGLPGLPAAAWRVCHADGRGRDHARRHRLARIHRRVRHPSHAVLRHQEQMALRAGEAQSPRCPRDD